MATDRQGDRTSQQGDGQDDTNVEQRSPGSARDQTGGVRGAAGERAAQARPQQESEQGGGSNVDRPGHVEQLGDEEAGDGMGT